MLPALTCFGAETAATALGPVTVFVARKIITMEPALPEGEPQPVH